MKAMNPQIQEAQRTSSTQNIKEHYTKAYMIKFAHEWERKSFFFHPTFQLTGRILVPWPWFQLESQQWKYWAVTTGPLGNSLRKS